MYMNFPLNLRAKERIIINALHGLAVGQLHLN